MAYTTIDDPFKFFNTKLYTGTDTSQSLTGVGFQPDWTWIKCRSNGNSNFPNIISDAVRGVNKVIKSDTDEAEITNYSQGYVSAFDSDGFTVTAQDGVSGIGRTYVAWNWLAGNSASSNSDGDITSTVSANTTSGFSVVSYTGNGSTNQTIGHGLGAIPDFIIVKQRNTTRNWPTYTKALGNGVAFLDITDAWAGGSSYQNYWYTSGMTSSTFGISNNDNTNASSGTFIAYCFSAKQGYSKMGTYTGNGNADGAFLYTGFKPAFFMIKRTTSAGYNWLLYDNKRQVSFNVVDDFLYPDGNDAETTGNANQSLDFLSNGIKFRGNGASSNGDGIVYLYMAFAESPFVTAGTKAAGTAR